MPMNDKQAPKNNIQLIWGIALFMVGIAVFVHKPQAIPRLQEMNQAPATLTFIRFCFYFIGFILVGGGIKKIVGYFTATRSSKAQETLDTDDNGSHR